MDLSCGWRVRFRPGVWTGRPALAIGYDWIPHDFANPFPGGVMFVRTDTSFTTRDWYPRRLPMTSGEAPAAGVESRETLRAFPNPAGTGVRIQWGDLVNGHGQLSLVNVLGEQVAAVEIEGSTEGIELDLRALPPGSYRVMVRGGRSVGSTTFLKY